MAKYRSSVQYTAGRRLDRVVEILLGREEDNSDKPNYYSQTPLLCTARYGHEGAVEILRREEVSPDRLDNKGQTPLRSATT